MNGGFWVGDTNGTGTKLVIQGTNPQNGVGFHNLGVVNIYTGGNLDPRSGFTQQSGSISTIGALGTAYICNDSPSGGASVVVNGGYIGFAEAGQTLEAGGDFSMTGGRIGITIDATAGKLDAIYSYNGSITINNGITFLVNTINIPPQRMPTADWVIFKCLSINGTVTINPNRETWDESGYNTYTYGSDAQDFWLHSTAPGS
jgi:hypothetical protein